MKTQLPNSMVLKRLPSALRLSKTCQKETPHEIRRLANSSIRICVPCLERAALSELDRG
jgi:hypothetical protein